MLYATLEYLLPARKERAIKARDDAKKELKELIEHSPGTYIRMYTILNYVHIPMQCWLFVNNILYSYHAVSFNEDNICDWLQLEQGHQSYSAGTYICT